MELEGGTLEEEEQRGEEQEDMDQDSLKQSGGEQEETEREQAENCGKEVVGAEQERELNEESADMELDLEHSDEEWNPEASRKQRTKNEYEIKKMLKESDIVDILERDGGSDQGCSSKAFKLSYKVKERRELYGEEFVSNHTDHELFESGDTINNNIKETEAFKARATAYTDKYIEENIEGNTSQEILCSYKNSPEVVKESPRFKEKLQHLTKKEKSNKIGMESLRETMETLKVVGSQQGREQKKILAASVTSLEFGVPELGLSSREEKQVLEMKRQLISGEQLVLSVPTKETRKVFPQEVQQVVEPTKHRRLSKAVKYGEETVPTRYQTMTNDETYDSLKENYTPKIQEIMQKHSQERCFAALKRPDSQDKEYRLRYALESLPQKFPSPSWWLQQRPKEVKKMHDHSTGLCNVLFKFIMLSDKTKCSNLLQNHNLYCRCARGPASITRRQSSFSRGHASAVQSFAPTGSAPVM